MAESLYETLGVPRDADERTIRSAYRRKAKKAHPDTGGSAEAFAEISRALAILTNPETRDRYDRAGEAEPSGPDNEAIEVANMVMQAVLHAVQQGDARFVDVVRGGLAFFDGKIGEVTGEIATNKRSAAEQIAKYETVLDRLTRKTDDGPDMLTEMLRGAVGQINRQLADNLAVLEPRLRKMREGRRILAGYEYRADAKTPATSGSWIGLDDLIRQQAAKTFFTR